MLGYTYIAHLPQQCHNSKFVIFQKKRLKHFEMPQFSMTAKTTRLLYPAASFANRVMTLHPLKSASANIFFYTNNSKMPNFEL
jgi:hypothetical protein